MINKCIICGRLANNLEIKRTTNDTAVINSVLAVDRDSKDKKTDFISFTVWGKSAEYLYNYAVKGALVAITGKYQIDKYEASDGTERKNHYINVDSVKIISNPKKSEKNTSEPQHYDDGDIMFD